MPVLGKKYCIDRKNILAHELIGLNVRVVDSTDKERIGLKGMVVDETKNTLRVESLRGEKLVPKKECVFEFVLSGNERVEVDGSILVLRPEDRTKEYWRKAV